MYTYIYICTSTAADFTTQVCVGVCMDILHMCPRASQVCKCGCITFVYVLSHTFFPHMYLRGHVLYVWCVCLRNAIRLHMCTPPTHVHAHSDAYICNTQNIHVCTCGAFVDDTPTHIHNCILSTTVLVLAFIGWRIALAYCMCVRLVRLFKIRPHIHKCIFSTTVLALAFISCGVLHVCTSGAFVYNTPTHTQMHFLYIAYVSACSSTRVSVVSTLSHTYTNVCFVYCICIRVGVHMCGRIARV